MAAEKIAEKTAEKTERAGVGFAISRQAGPSVVEVRLHHDTISSLRGIRVAFELLNGTTPAQAKRFLDVLNENVIGVRVTTASDVSTDHKTEAASG
jgi:hypothetical protein